MEYGCPLCNGFVTVEKQCSCCGHEMSDCGMIEDYYGPYSPYENADLYEPQGFWMLANSLPCVHLFSCPNCGFDKRIGISQVLM